MSGARTGSIYAFWSGLKMTDIKSMTLTELTDHIAGMGEPAFRARQLYQWMHAKCVSSLDDMTNIPKSLKARLSLNVNSSATG